tara:strand:+ start:2212 stop:2463 length:252 start_codon:yes stop_codon:yes gene_type:complete
MQDYPEFTDFKENKPLPKVNQLELLENVINCTIEEKIRLLKFIYSDLDLLTIKEASDKLGITPNGIRKTKELIDLGGKKFTRL